MGLRARVLRRLFELLYSPLVFLHEPAGVCLFGPSWRARRDLLAKYLPVNGTLLDLGCGGGHLLANLPCRQGIALGVDPSRKMARRAARRGQSVIVARSGCLPLREASIDSVVMTYPGPWVTESRTWDEIARVTVPGAEIRILLGGTVTRGRLSGLRSRAIGLIYGEAASTTEVIEYPGLDHPDIEGCLHSREDRWGTAFVWEGVRRAG